MKANSNNICHNYLLKYAKLINNKNMYFYVTWKKNLNLYVGRWFTITPHFTPFNITIVFDFFYFNKFTLTITVISGNATNNYLYLHLILQLQFQFNNIFIERPFVEHWRWIHFKFHLNFIIISIHTYELVGVFTIS